MQKSQSVPRPNRRSLAEHPHYFGAFLNLARHNAFMVMKHLSAKYDTDDKDILDEASLSQAKLFNFLRNDLNKPDVTHAVLRDLRKYFPFLNYRFFLNEQIRQKEFAKEKDKRNVPAFPEPEPEKIKNELQGMFTLLNKLRNNHSHYISSPDYSKLAPLPIPEIYKAAVFRLVDKGKNTKRFDVFEKDHIHHLEDKGSEYAPKDLKAFPTDERTIAFITCLFLERKYAFPLLSRLDGFQNTTNLEPTKEMKAIMECYTMFCCRLPQPKLESSDILLDMLNELGRCPSALYTVLSDEDRRRFHVKREGDGDLEDEDANAGSGQDLPDDYSGEVQEVEQEVVLKRFGDRFPYFALRYFDDTEAFPTLRFDVYLGRWRTRPVYDKVIYGENRERLITKPIRTYARIKPFLGLYEAVTHDDENGKRVSAEFATSFHESWLTKGDKGDFYLRDEIEHFSPHYNFGDNVIGLRFVNPKRHVFPTLPDPKNEKPDAVISTHELRNLFLYHYLHTTPVSKGSTETYIPTDAETFIKDYMARIRRFFADVRSGALKPLTAPPDYRKNEPLPYLHKKPEETKKKRAEYRERQTDMEERRNRLDDLLHERYGLSTSCIPDELKEYLLAYRVPSYKERAVEKFKKQEKALKELLKDAEKGRSPRVGEQATWLAEDIIFLTPPEIHTVKGKPHEQKLNNDQFRVLQSSLAYFSTNRDAILHFLKVETPILSNDTARRHPFLFKVDIGKCKGIFDFYLAYLKAKEKWLEKILDKDELRKLKDEDMERKYAHFLPSSVNHKEAPQRDYSNLPVFLPRGLFNEAIAGALAKNPGLGVKPSDNSVHSMARLLGGDLQEFYELPHFYSSIFEDKGAEPVAEADYAKNLKVQFKELKTQKLHSGKLGRDDKQALKDDFRDVNRAKTALLNREQHIRTIQANDRALWLMVKARQGRSSEHLEIDFDQLKLRNIESVLGKPVKVKLRIPGSELVITDDLSLRRYGDLRRIAKDRRLENLALYYKAAGETGIPHDLVKREFEKYDRRREKFFEVVYEFEKEVYMRFQGEFTPDLMSRFGPYFEHRTYVDIAVKHSSDTPFNMYFKEQVAVLRSKFHHNEFPWFEWLSPEVEKARGELYADRVFDIAEGYYRRMHALIRG